MSDASILSDTDRTTGRDALRKNIQAALALSGAIRSTLGPRGLDKLLIDSSGRTLTTNDGVTVLETAKVEHPVAKMLINASSVQDKIARDGTTSTVLISAEMLNNAWHLVTQGVHPSMIARGYRMAEEYCRDELLSFTLEATKKDRLIATQTSLAGKGHEAMRMHLARLSVEAAEIIVEDQSGTIIADPTRVKVLSQSGGAITDSQLVTGLVLAKKRILEAMPKKIGAGKILIINGGIERRAMASEMKLNVTSTGVLQSFRDKEMEILLQQVNHLQSIGVTLLACREGIDDDIRSALN
ncbi:MAG: thermosome subunit, partial [Euryarchaeota archaeon]|nr:thermosome subunit [Euryarchaeota archaeon]